jgi:hypothetical protein
VASQLINSANHNEFNYGDVANLGIGGKSDLFSTERETLIITV